MTARITRKEPAPGIVPRRCEKTAEIIEIRRRLEREGYWIVAVQPNGIAARMERGGIFVIAGDRRDA